MKISVLMAVPQGASRIEDALASVRFQTHPDWELLVVECGASGESRQAVHAFAALTGRPVTHHNLGENQGVASARNRLLELASGEWLAFLDPSDRWTQSHLTNAAIRLVGSIDVVASDVLVERPHFPLNALTPPTQLDTNPTRALFVSDALPVISAVAFRRALAARIGAFDSELRDGGHRDFWLRGALHGARFACTGQATCHTMNVGGSTAGRLLLADQQVQFYEKHQNLVAMPAALRRQLLSTSLVTKGRLMRAANPAAAARCFARAWTLQPMHIQTLGQLALVGLRPDLLSLSLTKPPPHPPETNPESPPPP